MGTGGSQRLVIDSALNVISTALAGRPAAEVVASGLSPAVNNQIKKATTDAKGNVNTALNLTAHALWGAERLMRAIVMLLRVRQVQQAERWLLILSCQHFTINHLKSSAKKKNVRYLL